MKTKFMTLMTVATLGIFSAATVMAAGNNDFYTQPPAGSEWEKQILKVPMQAIRTEMIM